MATVTTGTSGTDRTVVLMASSDDQEVLEHLTPDSCRRLAVRLIEAAADAEKPTATDWP